MEFLRAFTEVHDRCVALSDVNYTNFGVSLFILVGLFISYLPQHMRIITRKSSFGLSPYFVLLGTTSATCSLGNILVLPTSRSDIGCCREISGFACFAGLLGIAQIAAQWICFSIILLLFLIYFPRATNSTLHPDTGKQPSFRSAIMVMIACVVHALIIVAISAYFVIAQPGHTQAWANFLGIFAASLSAIQYIPQIYTTWKLKRVGSLSIPMMCIQTPGGFLWAGSLAYRLGLEGWSTWGIFVMTGCMQAILLVLGSYFEITQKRKDKQAQKEMASSKSMSSSEQTPLLRT